MVLLGQFLISEYGLTEQGVQLLERAIKQHESADAMFYLADHLYKSGVRAHFHRVVPLLEHSLRSSECPDTIKLLAKVTFDGIACRKDGVLAAQLYERALRLTSDIEIDQCLAEVILKTPQLVAQKERAMELYNNAIRRSKDPHLMNSLGLLYHHGTCNVSRSFPDAVKWYQTSIKKGDLIEAKCNLAEILAYPHPKYDADVVQAVRILEDACEQQRNERALVLLAQIYDNCEQVRNRLRAVRLYKRAFRLYGAPAAYARLIKLLLLGDEFYGPDYRRAVSFCLEDAVQGNSFGMAIACGMFWSGIREYKWCLPTVIDVMKDHVKRHNQTDKYGAYASLLRFKKRDLKLIVKRARSKLAAGAESAKALAYAIILGETGRESDLREAEERLRELLVRDGVRNDLVWVPLYIRKSKIPLPFRGDCRIMTDGMKRIGTVWEATTLNLASLLLERASIIKRNGEEALALLESLLCSKQKLVAVLNLGYVLWHGISGVGQNREKAIELYQQEVNESNDAAARSVLANALAQVEQIGDEEVHNTWMAITDEIKDKKELLILSRMISQTS
ncbi:hypothetical protein FGB62_203g032 [Gracilaria domingensis]|nr:hypothetical protein FGB62_203g032 [Gracilaria domingensis]